MYTVDTGISWFSQKEEWKGLKAFGKCEGIVTTKGKKKRETRYFISSLTDVKRFAEAVRNHWSIENNLHWCLAVIFRDDGCPVLEKIQPGTLQLSGV